MSLKTIEPSPGYLEHLPIEYKDLVEHGPYGREKPVKVTDMGKFKEVMEEHPMCAGCAMTLFIRLVMIGIPSNDFGKQEPGTNKEIKNFCEAKFGITFPMSEKVIVKGKDKSNELDIPFAPMNMDLKLGDVITTSGMAERFKPNIPIGKISSINNDKERKFAIVTVSPNENIGNSSELILIWDYKPNKKDE